MSQKFDVANPISLENSSNIKEEFQDEYYPENKVCVSETAINNISNIELNEYIGNDKIRKYEMLPLDRIKTDTPSSELSETESDNVKIEAGICPANIQIEFCNDLLFCNHCHQVYQDYCTKCRVLVHILNKIHTHDTYNRVRELPKYMLETRKSIGHLGIFSLKDIPEDVKFGPFTGLNSTGLSLKIKGGRLVVSDDQSEFLNWMQYINPAKNIYEQNLFPFQYEDQLYYCTTRRIQEGEELLVCFGEEYKDNLRKNVEMDFVPITKEAVENVFACTFCCLGFRSKEYLAEHKAACHGPANKMFSVEELVQCSFCKMYLVEKEYLEYHMDYCCKTNVRYSVVPTLEVHKIEVKKRSSLRSEAKKRKRRIYKCTRCKFRTMYSAEFRYHTNEHYVVKIYKCEICHRRYKARESLKAHLEKNHADNIGRVVQKYSTVDCFKPNLKNIDKKSPRPHGEKQYQSSKYKFQTRDRRHLKSLIKIKQLDKAKYKCANCEFTTYYRTYLEMHKKMKHLLECNYKCMKCEYRANRKSQLEEHIKAKHLKLKCTVCEYKTNYKSHLEKHIKIKHLKQEEYKCAECEYETNYKNNLIVHVKTKHLEQRDYQCANCEYMTNYKWNLAKHIKTKHLKVWDYKCMECGYETNIKSNLKEHIKTKHLKVWDYKCMKCEFQTNHKFSLKAHLKTKHLKLKEYKCIECEYEAIYNANLKQHIKTKHLKLKEYNCAECEFQTSYKDHLNLHVEAKHVKEKDYKCVECKYKTNTKRNLKVHIKARHLNDYKCTDCEFKTNDKSNLEVHIIETKHKASKYKCAECEFQTDCKPSFEKHVKTTHLKVWDYKCAECEFRTNYKSNLERHIKTKHLKQKEYKCTECEFQTKYKYNLRVHVKTHLKHYYQKKDYKCADCEYMANYKSDLVKHLKRKHLKKNINRYTDLKKYNIN